jgi:hypothetical protein
VGNAVKGLDWSFHYWLFTTILTDEDHNFGTVLETTAYRNNGFEQWAYRVHNPDSLDADPDSTYPNYFNTWFAAVIDEVQQ